MRGYYCLAAVLVLAPPAVAAQSGTSAGVQAIVRGDYAGAVRILSPLAEGTSDPDPLAQFFLAALYHAGRGVSLDTIRACGLYRRASTAANPLMTQAVALAETIAASSPMMRELCQNPRGVVMGGSPFSQTGPGSAQTVADGIDALVSRDYQRAVEILNAVAERWPMEGDGTAEFLLAMLNENGLGTPRNPIRACALYLRATPAAPVPITRDGPFAWRAVELAAAVQRSMSREQSGLCFLLADIGFDHGFEPVTFSLDPGHWIRFELSTSPQGIAATIFFNGQETRVQNALGLQSGFRYLPLEHTELLVGPSRQMRRHFIESFVWMRVEARRWSLMWFVSEVIRERLEQLIAEEVLTIDAERPPAALPDSMRAMARLRVNDDGDAEWMLVKDGNRFGDVIETEAERREVEEQRRARAAADAKVEWARVLDPGRPPSLSYSDADGCGNLFVYGWSADRTEAIAIRVDRETWQLSAPTQSFEIRSRQLDVEIEVTVFNRPQESWPFCTDVIAIRADDQREKWTAAAGTITVTVSPPGIRRREPHSYRATIALNGVTFVNAAGARVTQQQPITLTAVVASGFY